MNEATLTNLLAACRTYRGGEVDGSFNDAAQAFYVAVKTQPRQVRQAARALKDLPPPGAGLLSNMLGAIVETGGSVARSGPEIWALFLAWLPQVHRGFLGDKPLVPRQQDLREAFPLVAQAVVTHMAQLPQERALAMADAGLLAQLAELQDYTPGAAWVRQMLICRSDGLIALHVESGRGFRLRYDNIPNCFHLLTLLQAAIGERLPGGRVPNRFIVDMARCVTLVDETSDEAWWHYGVIDTGKPGLLMDISGEASPQSIPRMDGMQLLLLRSPMPNGMAWDAGFFTPQLFSMPANVHIEAELSAKEAQGWLAKAGLPAEKGE